MKKQTDSQKNREIWLQKAIKFLGTKIFKPLDYELPEVRVSVGFTGSKAGNKAIGSCWKGIAADDNVAQIFISPIIDDSCRVLDILAHELIHAIYPDAGHRGPFRKCALAIGLEGKMTATIAGDDLRERLNAFVKKAGNYPHASLNAECIGGKKKQTSRLLKASCSCCGYTVRIAKTWALLGLPNCPIDDNELVLEIK